MYQQAIHGQWPVRDISANFSRASGVRAAAKAVTPAALTEALSYCPDGQEHTIRSLLFLDESIAEGKTAAAVLHHLRAHGMPTDATVTLAACVSMI